MTEYLVTLLTMMALVWAGTEGIGRVFKMRKDRLSLIFGLVLGIALYGSGWLPSAGSTHGWWWPWVLAGLSGLLASMGAQLAHEFGVKAALGKRGK